MILSQSEPTMWKESITYFYQVYLHLKKPFYTRLGVKGTKRRQWRVIAACWLSFPGHRTLRLQVCWSDRPPIWSLSVDDSTIIFLGLTICSGWYHRIFFSSDGNANVHTFISLSRETSEMFLRIIKLPSPPSSSCSFSFFPFLQLFSSVLLSFFSFYLFLFCFFLFSTSFFSNFLVFFFNFFLFLFILLFFFFEFLFFHV